MAGCKDLSGGRFAQHPFQRRIPAPPEIGGDPDPVKVHVDRKCGCGCVIGEAALLAAYLRQ